MDSLVIVPTYNEAGNLDRLARAILDLEGFDLLVVDDNSPDGTGRVAEELRDRYPDRISILHRPSKLGIGTAYLEGFRIALTREYPYVFQMDADFSHDPADLPRLRDALGRAGPDHLVAPRSDTNHHHRHTDVLLDERHVGACLWR